VAASNYSVNIKLNTKPAVDELGKLEKRVNKLRRNLNSPLRIESKAVVLQKQQTKLQDRRFATMKVTARLGNQVRRLKEKGIKIDKLELDIKKASKHLDKGRVETSRAINKSVADELKTIEKALQTNIQTAGVDKDRIKSLTQVIGLKRTEAALNRTAGKTAAFMDSQRRGVGPNNLLGLPSTEMLKPSKRGIKILDLGTQGRQQTSVPFGPQIATAKQLEQFGTGASAMSIDSRFAQQRRRLKFQFDLNMLEAKGVKTTKLRAKMAELVDAQNRKQFGSIKRINNQLSMGIRKEQNKLKLLREQGRLQRQIASGKFAKGSNFGQIGGSIGPALPPRNAATAGRGFDIQSALISGGFPLLFGQGPFVGAAGALGGGIGGMFGQMGGFAGGIAATTVATTIQTFAVETGKLGAALNDATKDVEAVSAALGITGTEFEKNLKTLQNLGGEEAAFEAARQRMINLVGKDGVDALQNFGKGTTELSNQFTIAMTQMKAGLASFVQGTGVGRFLINRMTTANLIRQSKTSEDREVVRARKIADAFNTGVLRRSKEERELVAQGKGLGYRGYFDALKGVEEAQKRANEREEDAAIEQLLADIQKQRVKSINDEIVLLEKSKGLSTDEFEIEKQIMQMKQDGKIKDEDEIRNKLKYLQDLQKERQLAEETAAAFERMSQAIATDISQGIQGMIRGTSTLNDMMNNVLNKMIDAAFNMAFFGNLQGTLGRGGLLGGLFRANGGPVKGGKSYIVGERGPEMFTPGVSGAITPNHQLGGSTSVVVNVDASGSAVEGDEDRGRELGRLISVAVQSELIQQKRPGGLLA